MLSWEEVNLEEGWELGGDEGGGEEVLGRGREGHHVDAVHVLELAPEPRRRRHVRRPHDPDLTPPHGPKDLFKFGMGRVGLC